jgi:peptide/nickel transport system substrate-binding protein
MRMRRFGGFLLDLTSIKRSPRSFPTVINRTPRVLARWSATALACTAALLLTGCSAPVGSPATAGGGGDLTVALAAAPDTLDPAMTQSRYAAGIMPTYCDKLYDITADQHIVPMLATAPPVIGPDGKTYTIKLRSGVLFNDGTPFDAQAVKTSLDRSRTDKRSSQVANLSSIQDVAVVDPTTVKLTLSEPSSPLTSVLADRAGMIVSPAALSKEGAQFGTAPVCVGPFSFDSRPSSDRIVFKKSDYYYDKSLVKLNQVTFQVVTQPSIRATNLKSGDVGLALDIVPADIAGIQSNPSTTVITQTSLGYRGLTINVNNTHGVGVKPFTRANTALAQSQELRQAFVLSLDRDAINKAVYGGQQYPSCSPISTENPLYADPGCPATDVAKAKQMVAQSGMPTPIPVSIMIGAGDDLQTKLGTVIQSMAKEAGFAVTLKPEEVVTAGNDAKSGNFDIYMNSWSGRVDPDQNIEVFWSPSSTINYSNANYPDLNALLKQAAAISDPDQRKALYQQIVQLQNKYLDNVVLFHDRLVLGANKNVKNVVFLPNAVIELKTASITSGS